MQNLKTYKENTSKDLVETKCACGCGATFFKLQASTKVYIHGHNNRGKKVSKISAFLRLKNPMKFLTAEKKHELAMKGQLGLQNKLANNPEFAKVYAETAAYNTKKMWASMTVEKKREMSRNISTGLKKVQWNVVNKRKFTKKHWYKDVAYDSGYTVGFLKFLDYFGVEWWYEKIKVKVPINSIEYRTYTPDLWLPTLGVFVEIKGWLKGNHYAVPKLKAAKCIIPLLVFSKKFLNFVQDGTEPSLGGNTLEGVEHKLHGLQMLKSMAMKAQERRNFPIMKYDTQSIMV